MTREEAKEELNNFGYTINEQNSIVDRIYDEFEARTCENCKYYTYCSKENGLTNCSLPYHRCSNNDIDADGTWFCPPNKNFGCNLFERKIND